MISVGRRCTERPYDVGDMGRLENGKVVGDRSAADFAGMGKTMSPRISLRSGS
ncbi:MAG: hypothetical protein MZV70_59000 [Desulfobacterales bacterium]|nr:hypothetical protein [Desulfobacterales bacterium]